MHYQSLIGDEQWKVLVRNNIRLVVPNQAKSWKLLAHIDLLSRNFPMTPIRSIVFKTIWKSWEIFKCLISSSTSSLIIISFVVKGPYGGTYNTKTNLLLSYKASLQKFKGPLRHKIFQSCSIWGAIEFMGFL